jgi:uncharacterized protein (TIGR03086 family)
VVPLTRGLELLVAAVRYALAGAGPVTPQLLPLATPCAGWDLRTLLSHVTDSLDVLSGAVRAGYVGPGPAPGTGEPGPDPAGGLRCRATRLLAACTNAGPGERLVAIADRELTVNMVALAGALEIAVHGWDISVTCGARLPVPPGLAATLLPIAPLLITPSTRPGLFADPVWVPGPASPGDRLVAFLGRQPGLLAAPRSA